MSPITRSHRHANAGGKTLRDVLLQPMVRSSFVAFDVNKNVHACRRRPLRDHALSFGVQPSSTTLILSRATADSRSHRGRRSLCAACSSSTEDQGCGARARDGVSCGRSANVRSPPGDAASGLPGVGTGASDDTATRTADEGRHPQHLYRLLIRGPPPFSGGKSCPPAFVRLGVYSARFE